MNGLGRMLEIMDNGPLKRNHNNIMNQNQLLKIVNQVDILRKKEKNEHVSTIEWAWKELHIPPHWTIEWASQLNQINGQVHLSPLYPLENLTDHTHLTIFQLKYKKHLNDLHHMQIINSSHQAWIFCVCQYNFCWIFGNKLLE